MTDRLPGSSYDNPIRYRDCLIYLNPSNIDARCDWLWSHTDYDGAPDANDTRCGFGRTVEDCKADIDACFEEDGE